MGLREGNESIDAIIAPFRCEQEPDGGWLLGGETGKNPTRVFDGGGCVVKMRDELP
ncbi:hypothetical protein [Rhodoblastus sp.]|jgi:hypothetical protein|uniref:hypothetical protein n=1 Tax=Rhodoblastus sp. TaxID=1962975 RepID=UPI00262FD4EF|nr:hypothetical protein [Rhodoblastus sp.]